MTRPPAAVKGSGGTILRLTSPVGAGLSLVIVLAGLCVGFLELGLRIGFVARRLPRPVRVASLPVMDVKLHELDALVDEEGGVDCLFFGGWAVETGMNSGAFEQAYRTRVGRAIRCFNFGMRGASMGTVARLAEILVRRHSVGLIIVGIAVESPREEMGQILDERATQEPWLRLQDGLFDVEGWLIEHSAGYREFLGIRRRLFYPPNIRLQDAEDSPSTAKGSHDEALQVSTQSLDALEKAIRTVAPWHAVVVEMPLRPGVARHLSGGEADYERGIVTMAERVKQSEASFWRAQDLGSIPDEGWRDDLHLTRLGAGLLSEGLGARVGDAVHRGIMPDPVGGRSGSR